MATFHTTLEHFQSDLWGYHFPIPENIAQSFRERNQTRVICTINNKLTQQCALLHSDGYTYILINKTNRQKLDISQGDEVLIELEADQSDYGMPMPQTLQSMLDQDPEVNEIFHSLTKGRQRNLIFIVNSVKREKSQINKVLAIAEHLSTCQGNLDFKVLNQLIRKYNQQNKLK